MCTFLKIFIKNVDLTFLWCYYEDSKGESQMRKLKIWRLIFANILILGLMILILLITPNEALINQAIIGTYIITWHIIIFTYHFLRIICSGIHLLQIIKCT